MNIYKTIYKEIKKYDKIVIARHIGADPDALASSIALRDIILNTFPNKKVYTIGTPAGRFKFLGIIDKLGEDMYEDSLLIVTDTPDKKRVDGTDVNRFKNVIKIDHHPFIDDFGGIEWIDDSASSASQMIIELVMNTRLVMSKEAAEKLYIGLISDTNRFLYHYTTPKTFDLVSELIKKTNIDFTNLYEPLYLKPMKEVRFMGYIANNLTITENGLAHIKTSEEALKEYDIDPSTANKIISEFEYVDEILVRAFFAYDKAADVIKGSIRSRGPIINEVATHYNGGGHIYASGVRLNSEEEMENLINELEEVCKKYKED